MIQVLKRAWSRDRSQLPLQWWFPSLIACLAVFVAGFGMLHADEIKSSAPFVWGTGPVVWPALVFWGALLACGSLIGLMLSARNETTRTGLAELKERSTELQARIQALPPKGFLVTFEDLFRVSFDVDSRAGESEEGLKASIAVALGGIASLVRAFSSRAEGADYFVNLMVFRSIGQIRPEDLVEARPLRRAGRQPEHLGRRAPVAKGVRLPVRPRQHAARRSGRAYHACDTRAGVPHRTTASRPCFPAPPRSSATQPTQPASKTRSISRHGVVNTWHCDPP